MNKNHQNRPPELTREDETHIMSVFRDEVMPKLQRLDARLGSLSCAFAGVQYKNWLIEFRSVGRDFEIVDFQYDEEGEGLDLDL
jgi:hypothetical protein